MVYFVRKMAIIDLCGDDFRRDARIRGIDVKTNKNPNAEQNETLDVAHSHTLATGELPSFISRQVSEARRYYFDLNPDTSAALSVVLGGWERSGLIMPYRPTFPLLRRIRRRRARASDPGGEGTRIGQRHRVRLRAGDAAGDLRRLTALDAEVLRDICRTRCGATIAIRRWRPAA